MTKIFYKISSKLFLTLAVLTSLLPFLNLRVLRMAGDEKVYLTTAIEMHRNHSWFVQTLADEPNYFKGPFHYLFTRLGLFVFGNQLIAGLWINLALMIAAGLAMHRLCRKRWNDKSGLLLGLAVALNVGVYSHSLASQMEVELCAFYIFAIVALGISPAKPSFRKDLPFWVIAGIAGWIKSPVYSVLIGVSGIFYWALIGELKTRARSAGCWFAAFCGIAAGVSGYLPAATMDFENFKNTFILREQFQKANNHRTWDYVMAPLIHFALPWTFVVLAALAKFLMKPASIRTAKSDVSMMKLGAAMSIPTMLMWATWSYKGQNYNLPAMSGLLLFAWAYFGGNIPQWTFRAAGALGAVFGIFFVGFVFHFWPLPPWWGIGWLALGLIGIALFSALFFISTDVRVLGAGVVSFFIAFGAIITPPGEFEMIGLRKFIKSNPADLKYHYYNLEQSIWSEWSLLQLSVHREILGLHRKSQLEEAVQPGHVILVQDHKALNVVLDFWEARKTTADRTPIITPWTRWLTKGKGADGQSRWKMAWESRELGPLEREFYIVQF